MVMLAVVVVVVVTITNNFGRNWPIVPSRGHGGNEDRPRGVFSESKTSSKKWYEDRRSECHGCC